MILPVNTRFLYVTGRANESLWGPNKSGTAVGVPAKVRRRQAARSSVGAWKFTVKVHCRRGSEFGYAKCA